MEKILLVSPFFSPELISTGKYNTHLAKGLVDAGASVDVLCSCSLYPDWKPECINQQISGMRIIRGGGFMRYPASPLLRRALLEIWFSSFFLWYGLFLHKSYDILLFVYPPNLVSILTPLVKKKDTRVVGIVHDIQGVMASAKKSRIRSFVGYFIRQIEGCSYKACENLVFLSESMETIGQELYSISSERSVVKYPFVTTDKYKGEFELDSIFIGRNDALVYSGALGEKQAPEELIRLLLEVLKTDDNVNAFIFSQGAVFDRLKLTYKNERLHFYPLVSEKQLPELIARSSVQIIPQAVEISDGAFPSKLPNLLAGKAKIFSITAEGSELDSVLNKYSKSSVHYSWEDIGQLALDLVNFMGMEDKRVTDKDEELLKRFSLSHLVEYIIKG